MFRIFLSNGRFQLRHKAKTAGRGGDVTESCRGLDIPRTWRRTALSSPHCLPSPFLRCPAPRRAVPCRVMPPPGPNTIKSPREPPLLQVDPRVFPNTRLEARSN
ncbi:hypothetical protein E2C01_068865 [Portunus trituberculatus]|uniref:Uncharacterized protein n=1 Tax=Portunus trituberculatus TaxID=210409 RepID=A0A5B7HXD6_PORTR|nr:hypothetical protein [Portunus trituberculatus]